MAYQVTRELEQLRKAFSQLLNTYISIVTVATMTNDITDEVHFVPAMPNKQWTRCGQRPGGLLLAHVCPPLSIFLTWTMICQQTTSDTLF